MRILSSLTVVTVGAFVWAVGCSSSSSSQCVPGASIACVGSGGCSTNQVCKSDGSGYDACLCPGADIDGGGIDGGNGDSGSNGDSAASGDGSQPDSATADSGSWSPSVLPGLVLWLDDTRGVIRDPQNNGVVARWLDQSGRGNDGNPINTQQGGPTFAIDPAVLNGHDAITCPTNSAWLNIADGADTQFGTGDFGIIVVGRFSSDANFVDKLNPMGGSAGWALQQSAGVFRMTTATGSAVVAVSGGGNFHIISGRGAALRIAADTATGSGPTNTSNLDFVGGGMRICFGGTLGTVNELAEVIVVKGTLSDSDLASATAYLKDKFRL